MTRLATILMALLMPIGCVTIVNQLPPPTVKDVWDVDHFLKQLHGQTVRLQGEINNCTSLTCMICDGPDIEEDACLPVTFFADSSDARYLLNELYRFATITIDARVDARCRLGYNPEFYNSKADSPEIVVCTDGGSALEDARVISVDARKSARDGRFDMYVGRPLQEAGAEQFDKVTNLIKSLGWVYDDEELDHDHSRLFIDPEPLNTNKGESYILCGCKEETCRDKWPTMSGRATTRSPANPYGCQYITQVGENWVFSP